MIEHLICFVAAAAVAAAIGRYFYGVGRDTGYAEGHRDGELGIRVSPNLSGGPREPA